MICIVPFLLGFYNVLAKRNLKKSLMGIYYKHALTVFKKYVGVALCERATPLAFALPSL